MIDLTPAQQRLYHQVMDTSAALGTDTRDELDAAAATALDKAMVAEALVGPGAGARYIDTTRYGYYMHTTDDLANGAERGAADLRRQAAAALARGDQDRHDRKLAAAAFVDRYADSIRAGGADHDHAQTVVRAAEQNGLLIEPRLADPTSFSAQANPEHHAAEQAFLIGLRAELASAESAGLLTRVADDGQVPFYALPGYAPTTTSQPSEQAEPGAENTEPSTTPQPSKVDELFTGPAWERLKAERESGYTGWLDKDGNRVTDEQVTAMCHQHASGADTGTGGQHVTAGSDDTDEDCA